MGRLARLLCLVAVCGLCATPAFAASAWRTLSGSQTAGVVHTDARPGEVVYLWTTDTAATLTLNATQCPGGFDVTFRGDTTANPGDLSATLTLYNCPVGAVPLDANRCPAIWYSTNGGALNANSLNGDAANGKAILYRVRANQFVVVLANTNAHQVEAQVECHGGK